jgi:hypothetical protein
MVSEVFRNSEGEYRVDIAAEEEVDYSIAVPFSQGFSEEIS